MADTKIKITEVQVTETVKPDAYTLITQTDNNEVETLYRAPLSKPMFVIEINEDGTVGFPKNDQAAFEALLARIYQDNPKAYGAVSYCKPSQFVDLFFYVYTDYGNFIAPGWIVSVTQYGALINVNLGITTDSNPARLHNVTLTYGYGPDAGRHTITHKMYTLTPAT